MATTPTYPPRPRAGTAQAVRLVFGLAARLRGKRALHPDGIVFGGVFAPLNNGTGAQLFDDTTELPAVVRVSRGGGLPHAAPDILGCALRVPDAYGPGAHQDLALASSGKRPILRHALVPRRDFVTAFYSSLLPYRVGKTTLMLGAELDATVDRRRNRLEGLRAAVAGGGPLEVRIVCATPVGAWSELARVRLDRVVADPEASSLRFNPWNCGGGIRPLGLLNELRDPAYRASQEQAPGS